jgi:cysteine desulfurase
MAVIQPVYMDNHSTTVVDPSVVDVVVKFMAIRYGNAGSHGHTFGLEARAAIESARQTIAESIGADATEIVFTSGATESNNLAIRGLATHAKAKGKHIVSVATEHKAVLDPLARMAREGWEVTHLVPQSHRHDDAGSIAAQQVADAIRSDTLLVTVMLANNEIGVIQPLKQMGEICADRGVVLHTDATQAVGRIPVSVTDLGVGLMSFSAHKIYGPKGVGALYVRRRDGRVRISPMVEGGGQERGLRSGTLNVPGICGFAKALAICNDRMADERKRIGALRDRLFEEIVQRIPDVTLNGPMLDSSTGRLPGNLNVCFHGVDGEALMLAMRDLAVSSGSACTAAQPEPSHVLRALALDDDHVRSSLRFGLGRFNTLEEVDFAVELLSEHVAQLRSLGGMSS